MAQGLAGICPSTHSAAYILFRTEEAFSNGEQLWRHRLPSIVPPVSAKGVRHKQMQETSAYGERYVVEVVDVDFLPDTQGRPQCAVVEKN